VLIFGAAKYATAETTNAVNTEAKTAVRIKVLFMLDNLLAATLLKSTHHAKAKSLIFQLFQCEEG
jgi:hypothetical protein